MIKVMGRGGDSAEVLIYDPIGADWFGNGVTAKKFRDDLAALGPVSQITVRINSPGGEVFDGFAIYNALKQHEARVTVYVDGLAASIASVIAMAGDDIRMGEGAMLMVHSPWTVSIGDADDMRQVADVLDKIEVGLVDAYESRSGQPRATVEQWMQGETWFTRDEAIAAGLADGLAEVSDDMAAAAWTPSKIAARSAFQLFAATRVSKPPQEIAEFSLSATADPTSQEDVTMTTIETSAKDAADIRNQVMADESARRATIRQRFGKFADAHRILLDACLDDPQCSAETAGERLLAKLGEGAEPLRPVQSVESGADSRDKFIAGASVALAVRAGVAKREEDNEFQGMTLADMAAHSLRLVGVSVKGLSRDGIARKVLATMTSSDFPQLLSVNAGKVLRSAYDSFPNTWQMWCLAGEVSDFKVAPRIQLGSFNSLETIPEAGEYKYGSLGEDYENAQAVTKGKAIALTRQMIVNDDLGGFNRRVRLMGRAAARTVNGDAYAYLTSGSSNHGPTSADTGQYFNATAVTTAGGHANLTGPGTAMSVAAFGVGRVAMRKQKDKSLRDTLNIQPSVLVVPVGKEDLAKQLITSESDAAASNSRVANIYRNAFTVVSDPYLDGISATAWYLFANPADVAAFEVVFLDGNQAPFVDEAVDFDTDAMKFKVRLDYGVAIGDWRAAYKNVGA